MVPQLHDRYEILRPLARGGMAMVHLAREVDTGRELALKQLVVPEGAVAATWKLRFQQEFHTATRLRHPNVVATHDYAEPAGQLPFFTMEFLPGPGLEEALPLAPERVMAFLPGLLAGLAYLHRQGLVHGDLKPENLRFGADGLIRLMDLGLATRLGQPTAGLQGTLAYVAPEVIRRAPTDRRSDLYALGAVLYHLLAGHMPFEGDMRAVLTGHLEQEPAPLDVPEPLAALVKKLMAKDPLSRYQSADEVLRELAGDGGAAGSDDQTLFHAPLIGRVKELRELAGAFNRVKAGAIEEVWLHGDADAGLVALVEEFCCRAQLFGANVLRGGFRPRMAPLEGLRGVARGLAALARPHGEALSPLLPLLARIAPELGAASRPAPDADPLQERLRVFDALTQAVKLASAAKPLMLAFTEAHLAEPAWREWLEYLRRNAPGATVLVLVASAGESDFDLDPGKTSLDLGPFAPEQTREACCAILGQQELAPEFVERVHAVSAGWPGRVEACLRWLAAEGRLRREAGEWQLPAGDLAPLTTPAAPTLPTFAAALYDVVVVLGREVELLQLWHTASRLVPEVLENAALFEALGELERERRFDRLDGSYQLSSEQDRELAFKALAPERRAAVHAAIAAQLEATLDAEDLALQAELATHALAAGLASGPRHALEAARGLARMFALEAAEELLAAALELPPDPSLQLGLLHTRADVARLAGDRRLAALCYSEALALAEPRDTPANSDAEAASNVEAAALLNGLGRLELATGRPEAAEACFSRALDRLGEHKAHPEAAVALTMLGRCALTHGDLTLASKRVERALTLARELELRPLVRENMAQLGYLYVASSGNRDAEGLRLLFEAIQLVEKDEAKLELNTCYALLGNAQLLLGRFAEARTAFERNGDLCAEVGAAPHDEATAWMRRAQVALEVGDYRGARRAASPAAALAKMVGDKRLLAQVRLAEGLAALYQGDFPIYQDCMALAEETAKATAATGLEALVLASRAEAEVFLGATHQALASASAALELIEHGVGHEARERALVAKSEALLDMGLYKPARETLELLGSPRNDATHARALLVRARHDRMSKPEQARAHADHANTLARRAGVVPVAATCALLLGRLARDPAQALSWSRKALLDAEVCGQPALEAEALFRASEIAGSRERQLELATAAREAWRRATAGLTTAMATAFGNTEGRRALRDAVAAHASEPYCLTREDHELVLAILSKPPAPMDLFRAIADLAHAEGHAPRIALFWEDAEGFPSVVAAEGPPYLDEPSPARELELAREAEQGVVLVPLAAGELEPYGALLVAGVLPERAERLACLLALLTGSLWAARAIWLHERAAQRPVEAALREREPS